MEEGIKGEEIRMEELEVKEEAVSERRNVKGVFESVELAIGIKEVMS